MYRGINLLLSHQLRISLTYRPTDVRNSMILPLISVVYLSRPMSRPFTPSLLTSVWEQPADDASAYIAHRQAFYCRHLLR